jgi:hypothetical protein
MKGERELDKPGDTVPASGIYGGVHDRPIIL